MPDPRFPLPRPLVPLLAPELGRARREAWFGAAERSYGGARECWPVVLVGRLMRTGLLGARSAVGAWLTDPVDSPPGAAAFWNHVAEELEHQLAGVERWAQATSRLGAAAPADDSTGWTAVGARDDVESALWALGRAALEAEDGGAKLAERRVLVVASSVDTLAVAHSHTISAALRGVRLAGSLGDWLMRAAAAQPEAWWLDLVFEHTSAGSMARERLRGQVSGRPLPSLGRRPLRLGKGPGLAARAREADVIGCDLSLDQLRGGRVVARMFDGAVEVLVRGIADSDPAPVGLVVRVRVGTGGRIEAVWLDPAYDPSVPPQSVEPRAIENDWWVPLANRGPGTAMLRVRFLRPGGSDSAEECLAIEGG